MNKYSFLSRCFQHVKKFSQSKNILCYNSFIRYKNLFLRKGYSMKKILMIEDDLDLQEGLSFSLQLDGYETTCASTCKEGLSLLKAAPFDLVLLDCNLPDGNGFYLCSQIRTFSQQPILMLTARDTEMDEVKALELGVDDYMRKPFSLAVLKARIKKLLQHREQPEILISNGISIDKSSCTVMRGATEIICSQTEYRLLLYLMENKNRVLSKDQILNHIWDSDGKFVDDNTVSVNIRRLRTKIEDEASNPRLLKTVYGLGYLWKEE